MAPHRRWRIPPRAFSYRGQILAANESVRTEDKSKFTDYVLPTVFTFTRNLCIAQTCADDSGLFDLLAMVLLLTDWIAFYRCFVILLKYQYSQMNVRLPGGSTVDTAMFFGDRNFPDLVRTQISFIWDSSTIIHVGALKIHTFLCTIAICECMKF